MYIDTISLLQKLMDLIVQSMALICVQIGHIWEKTICIDTGNHIRARKIVERAS
jgi:hypothetical protein